MEDEIRFYRVEGLGFNIQGLGSKLLKGGYIGFYLLEYYRGY